MTPTHRYTSDSIGTGPLHNDVAHWATRAERAIPRIDAPNVRALDTHAMDDLVGLRFLLLGRPVIGAALLIATVTAGWWLVLPIALWFHYGSTATAIHHLIHGSLGLSPRARRAWLTGLGLLILESAHAWQTTHVMHHRDGTDLPDPEGYVEYLTWRQLPLGAFRWRFRIARWGWHHTRRRVRTTVELGTVAAVTVGALLVLPVTPAPAIYVGALQVGTFLFAIMLAKGPQTNFGRTVDTPLVQVHTRLLGVLLFNHHLHLEHHAYPKVPMARLHRVRPAVEHALEGENVHHVRLAA